LVSEQQTFGIALINVRVTTWSSSFSQEVGSSTSS
jgi:hypothetical protein